jgi:hypothetical protein
MIRKTSILILSIAIMVTGVVAFFKLGYWERSVRIFSISQDVPSPGKSGSGSKGENEFSGPEGRSFKGGIRNREGHRRGELNESGRMDLSHVFWFTSVFALFTLIAIYIDRGISLLRRRNGGKKCSAEIS